jgi:hypothetical protein
MGGGGPVRWQRQSACVAWGWLIFFRRLAIRCIWCEGRVDIYQCHRCGRGFLRVCKNCHIRQVHGEKDELWHKQFYVNEQAYHVGSFDPAWKYGDNPWQQNARRALEGD